MALFWKRKKEPEYISLGLNREATEEEKKIAERRDEGPEPDLVDKLKEAVTATRETLSERIDAVVGIKRQIDAQVLDELEEALIGADLGVQTSMAIIEKARQQVSRKQLNDVDELKRLIKDELKDDDHRQAGAPHQERRQRSVDLRGGHLSRRCQRSIEHLGGSLRRAADSTKARHRPVGGVV